MANVSIALFRGLGGLLLSGLVGGLISCEALNSLTSEGESSPTATASAEASASPSPGSTKAVAGQNVSCNTPNYSGEITWEGEEARMTFGRKPNEMNVNEASPVTILSNTDGSTTYGHQGGEITVYLRAYANGSCLLQALSSQGAVTVEEFGRTGFVDQVSVNQVSVNQVSSSSNPTIAQSPASPASAPAIVSLSSPANAAEQPIEQSKPAGTLLSCVGTIKDSVDFTAYFAPDAGFNRLVFRPRDAKVVAVSALSYSGKNSQGQDTWQGKANEVAEVRLVHLANSVPQRGDQISVDYDGLLGQAVCQ